MHNPWPACFPNLAQLGPAGERCIDQRAGGVTGPRVDDHSGWFIEHNDILILVNQIQADILLQKLDGGLIRDFNPDALPMFEPEGWLFGLVSINPNFASADQCLKAHPREISNLRGQKFIQASAVFC